MFYCFVFRIKGILTDICSTFSKARTRKKERVSTNFSHGMTKIESEVLLQFTIYKLKNKTDLVWIDLVLSVNCHMRFCRFYHSN